MVPCPNPRAGITVTVKLVEWSRRELNHLDTVSKAYTLAQMFSRIGAAPGNM